METWWLSGAGTAKVPIITVFMKVDSGSIWQLMLLHVWDKQYTYIYKLFICSHDYLLFIHLKHSWIQFYAILASFDKNLPVVEAQADHDIV